MMKMYLAYSTEYSDETKEVGSTAPIGVFKTRKKAISVIQDLSQIDHAMQFKSGGNVEDFIYNNAQELIYTVTQVEVEE
ncbi:hypothetical protein OXT66_03165 [Lentilactobacillus senioris]|uniref:hypothetical protein n=1 Tax=Lentilactobacillus senioris TaxID=931534 RepID=UPI00228279EC|nr:hypothetical protein [Lentilactobacillus senioris]MCY9806549.1 hypothetical protein [Lentilactobacillus senioris]